MTAFHYICLNFVQVYRALQTCNPFSEWSHLPLILINVTSVPCLSHLPIWLFSKARPLGDPPTHQPLTRSPDLPVWVGEGRQRINLPFPPRLPLLSLHCPRAMLVGIRSGACHRHTVRFVTGDFVLPFEKSCWVLWETIDVVCATLSSPLCLRSPRFEGWWRPVRQASGSLQTRVGCNFLRRWFALQLSRAPRETSREENRTHIFPPGPCLLWRRLLGIPWHRVNSLLRKKKTVSISHSCFGVLSYYYIVLSLVKPNSLGFLKPIHISDSSSDVLS